MPVHLTVHLIVQIRGTQGCAYVEDPERDVGEGWDVASACERERIEI